MIVTNLCLVRKLAHVKTNTSYRQNHWGWGGFAALDHTAAAHISPATSQGGKDYPEVGKKAGSCTPMSTRGAVAPAQLSPTLCLMPRGQELSPPHSDRAESSDTAPLMPRGSGLSSICHHCTIKNQTQQTGCQHSALLSVKPPHCSILCHVLSSRFLWS